MKTDLILISSEESSLEAALSEAEKVAQFKGLSGKNALHLRLLAEEMTSLMRAVTGEVKGEFWIEEEDGLYSLHLKAEVWTDSRQRQQLIATASSGKNEAHRGFMGKIRAFFEPDSDVPVFSGVFMPEGLAQVHGGMYWSMEQYRQDLQQYRKQQREGAQEAWDELEKSVVSRVADDVKVSIRGSEVELVILKKLA